MDKQITTKEDPLQILLINTFTKNEMLRRLRMLSDLINYKIFKLGNTSDLKKVFEAVKLEYSQQSFHPHFEADLEFFEGLSENFYAGFLPEHASTQLEAIEKQVSETKIILIYVPFEMPEIEIQKLGKWFKQNMGPLILFDLVFDPSLIGGCALSLNGIYKDYSLKQKINDNKSLVLEQLTGYKKS